MCLLFALASIVLIKLCVNVPPFNSLNNLICVFCSFFIKNQLQGSVDDCSCTIDTVDYFNNNKMHPRLKSLLVRDYFRFYKVNLRKECPFWADDGRCAMRSCHVSTCSESDVPAGLKGQHQQESFLFKVSHETIFIRTSLTHAAHLHSIEIFSLDVRKSQFAFAIFSFRYSLLVY